MKWNDVGSRWASKVGEVLGFTPDTELLGLSEVVDYQGSCHFVARVKPNKIVVYGWSYGSCSGCDSWEGQEHLIKDEVLSGAKTMTVLQFRKYAKGVIEEYLKDKGVYEPEASNYNAVVSALRALDEEA